MVTLTWIKPPPCDRMSFGNGRNPSRCSGPAELVGIAYAWVEDADGPISVMAPAAPGNFAIRFVEGVDGTVLASVPLRVIQARASLEAPETAMAGSPIAVRYTPAQAGSGSFITAVAPDAEPSRVPTHPTSRWTAGRAACARRARRGGWNCASCSGDRAAPR